ncbi:MAG: hypothetical protein LBD80_02860 [Tannerella sp.]|jgi:hypothetical protein|nr:hypothetical protein [Tannerella sp.]
MTAVDLLPEIAETLNYGIQNIEFGKISISFTVHESRIVSIERSFTNNIKNNGSKKLKDIKAKTSNTRQKTDFDYSEGVKNVLL